MECEELGISGVMLIRSKRHEDDRGGFSEVYNRRSFHEMGITDDFVQDNHSLSRERGTIRGLHFQIEPRPIAKLVRVTTGTVFDVAVDIRNGSPTYGEYVSAELTAENGIQIYVPPGFAHGFCTLVPDTEVSYKVTDYWSADIDKGVAWDDPDLAIDWPMNKDQAILSDKDRGQPSLADLPRYFEWGAE